VVKGKFNKNHPNAPGANYTGRQGWYVSNPIRLGLRRHAMKFLNTSP
jgi:hypothetical protein